MNGMNNYGNLFADELTQWFLDAEFIQSQCQMTIDYKYAPYGTNIFIYLMLMIVSIGIYMKLLENGLQTLQ